MFNIPRYLRVQIAIAACFNFNELIIGYSIGWPGPVLPKFDDPNQTPLAYPITEMQKSWIVSIIYFGFFGSYLGGYLANRVGRKKSLLIGGTLHLLSYLLMSFAKNLATLYVGRCLTGVAGSCLIALAVIYIGEIASPSIRGTIMNSLGVAHATGNLLVYCIGPFVNYAIVGYIGIGLNLIFLAFCFLLPESPMFFVLKDDEKSAMSVLKKLGRSEDIDKELKTMIQKVKDHQNHKHTWKELFKTKSNIKSLFVTVCLTCFQQCSGIVAVILYANTIFRYAASSVHPDIATIIFGATFVIGAIVVPMYIDKYGRRMLLMVSTAGLCVNMAGLGVYFYMRLVKPESIEHLGWLPLTLLILAQFFYSFGLAIIPNTLPGELFTPKVRGLGTSVAIGTGMVSGCISITIFSYLVVAVGIHVTFWLFSVSNAFAFVFVILFVPETMGKSLMEIQEMLD